MNEGRFDRMAVLLGAAASRRAGLAAAIGMALGGGSKADSVERGDRRPHREGPCGDGSGLANHCTKDRQCCTRLCNVSIRRCRCSREGNPCRKNRNCCNSMKCANGVCENAAAACDAATCADGCCNGTTCVTATDHSSCGRGGAACVSCSSLTPLCKTGTCSAGTWANQSTFGSDGDGNDNFDQPYGIFEGDTLTTWVADSSNNRISIWTRNDNSRSWSYSAKFGGTRGSGDSEFWQPKGVSVSEDRLTAWVADSNNHRISIWTRNDDKSTNWSYSTRFGKFGTGNDNFKNPSSVVVSADALTAWVADQMNDRISIWTRDDVTSTVWRYRAQFGSSGSGDSEFSGPSGIFVSSDTLTAWIADNGNSRIAIWTRSDSASTTWSYSAKFGKQGAGDSDLSNPNGVFASADSLTTWVADFGNNRISIWTRQNSASTAWTYSAKFGAQGTGGSDLWNPSGVFVSADSLTAWVSEYGNNRISVWAQG